MHLHGGCKVFLRVGIQICWQLSWPRFSPKIREEMLPGPGSSISIQICTCCDMHTMLQKQPPSLNPGKARPWIFFPWGGRSHWTRIWTSVYIECICSSYVLRDKLSANVQWINAVCELTSPLQLWLLVSSTPWREQMMFRNHPCNPVADIGICRIICHSIFCSLEKLWAATKSGITAVWRRCRKKIRHPKEPQCSVPRSPSACLGREITSCFSGLSWLCGGTPQFQNTC